MKIDDYSKYYIQGSDHYLIPKDVFTELFNEMINWKEENKKSKKQIEEINKMIEKCGFVNIEQVMLNYCGLLSQQKEFILYLEDEIKNINPKEDDDEEEVYRVYGYDEMVKYIMLKEILKKYKEIIGGNND